MEPRKRLENVVKHLEEAAVEIVHIGTTMKLTGENKNSVLDIDINHLHREIVEAITTANENTAVGSGEYAEGGG